MASFRENGGTLPGKAACANGAFRDELYLKRAYETADQVATVANIIMMEHIYYINNMVLICVDVHLELEPVVKQPRNLIFQTFH